MAFTNPKNVDPISRIEGHLGAKCNVNGSSFVDDVEVHGNLWRGFENFLLGREPNDAITFTQRICGVCPVPHGQASTYAVEAAMGYNTGFQTWVKAADGGQWSADGNGTAPAATPVGVPFKAVYIRNLILSAEFLMSSITHQYHLAAPSYIQGPNIPPWTPYFNNDYYHPLLRATGKGTGTIAATNANQPAPGYEGATLPLNDGGFSKDLWSAVIKSYVHALRIRRLTFEAGAMFAGRMPMTSSFVAGGVTTNATEDLTNKLTKFRNLIAEVGDFIVRQYVPIFLALGALYPNFDNTANAQWLAANAPTVWGLGNRHPSLTNPVTNPEITGWGAGLGNFISWGAFPQVNGTLGLARGFINKAAVLANSPATAIVAGDVPAATGLSEYITYSRYQNSAVGSGFGYEGALNKEFPGNVGRTIPQRNDAAKYSWMKAPRWNDTACEVGPMARMYVSGLFKHGLSLASTVTAAGIAGYLAYVRTSTLGTGLNPQMVHPDIAVALVREGLATLKTTGTDNDVTKYYDAESIIIGPVTSWIYNLQAGLSTMDRLRARALESLVLVQKMIGAATPTNGAVSFPALGGWVGDLNTFDAANPGDATFDYIPYPVSATSGFGGVEAPRGALMHVCTQQAGKIKKYQCIVPTTWNGSPRGSGAGDVGAIEAAIIGTYYANYTTPLTGGGGTGTSAGGGVEALRIAQSFDPCIACAVH